MYSVNTPIYLTQQIRDFERLAAERYALSGDVLMQRAGCAALDYFRHRWPQARKLSVFCGAGNNGGDGYVFAKLAQQVGLKVTVWQVGDHSKLPEPAQSAFVACKQSGLVIEPFNANSDIGHVDVMVDAICGIGLKEAVRKEAMAAMLAMQAKQMPILAIDVPTGIDADTGEVLGAAVHADATITFIGLKMGLLTGAAVSYVGELFCHDLQLPPELFADVRPAACKIHLNAYNQYLKPRPRDWHKGLSGHVLIVGGDFGYAGAPRMAGEAALRVGAGLVTIATRPQHAIAMNLRMPELMCRGVDSAKELEPLFERADVIVLGPGLGRSDWSKELWQCVLQQKQVKVVDADGLNLLAQTPMQSDNWVLTPHPGEAARLLQQTVPVIQQDRYAAVAAISKRYGGVSVLKGAGSLVFAANEIAGLCDKGNPGMASAGMGDVLSGVIGGLLAQGIPLLSAAKLGVCLHAMAGDLAAANGERGMVATDLMPYLRMLAN